LFLGKNQDGVGEGDAIRESTGRDFAFHSETKEFPQREAEGLRPRPIPRKDHCLVVSGSAAPSPHPCGGREIGDSFKFLQKRRMTRV